MRRRSPPGRRGDGRPPAASGRGRPRGRAHLLRACARRQVRAAPQDRSPTRRAPFQVEAALVVELQRPDRTRVSSRTSTKSCAPADLLDPRAQLVAPRATVRVRARAVDRPSAERALRIRLRPVNCASSTMRNAASPLRRMNSPRSSWLADRPVAHQLDGEPHPEQPQAVQQVGALELGHRRRCRPSREPVRGHQQVRRPPPGGRGQQRERPELLLAQGSPAIPSSPATGTTIGHTRCSRGSCS